MQNFKRPYEILKDKIAFKIPKERLKKFLNFGDIYEVLDSVKNYKGRGFYDRIDLHRSRKSL